MTSPSETYESTLAFVADAFGLSIGQVSSRKDALAKEAHQTVLWIMTESFRLIPAQIATMAGCTPGDVAEAIRQVHSRSTYDAHMGSWLRDLARQVQSRQAS